MPTDPAFARVPSLGDLRDILSDVRDSLSCDKEVVVAGGAVRDVLCGRAPKDIDVFILNLPGESVGSTRLELLEQFAAVAVPDWHVSEPFLQATILVRGQVTQVMASPEQTVEKLLDTFDWDVGRFAYSDSRSILAYGQYPREGAALRLHRVTYPMSTLRRGFRFSERFAMRLEKETVMSIIEHLRDRELAND